MALKNTIGGIKINDHQFTTVLPVEELLRLSLSGLAFEQDATGSDQFGHVTDRVDRLAPARELVQRSFFNRALKPKVVKDLETGQKKTIRVDAFTPSAKYRNATGDLLRYVKEAYIDAPEPTAAAMPAFVLYYPEPVPSTPADFNAGMGGEYHSYDVTDLGKAMILDGESRHLAMERALSDTGAHSLSGARKEKLRNKLVTVEVHHGLEPRVMGQIYADLNGKGVKLNSNETISRDVRDPWARATHDVFDQLGVKLQTSGRQVGAASQANGIHLMFNQARLMVRALGLGSFTGAVSKSDRTEGINFERVVTSGVEWIGKVLDHFGGPAVFTDPDLVVRTAPVKVGLGLMGNAWYDTDLEKRQAHIRSLSEINWRVRPEWNGIAGKVTLVGEDEYRLSAAGPKESGTRCARALTNASSADGRKIRPGL